jgi:preprotein translocase subunit SecG
MVTALAILQVLVSMLLILVVLIQGGENVDMAAAFGGSSQAAFGPRGAVTTIQKITWILAGVFMITSVTLTVLATRTSSSSVLQNTPAKSAPATPVPVPAKK